MKIVNSIDLDLQELTKRPAEYQTVLKDVSKIIEHVKNVGDPAVKQYAEIFNDKYSENFEVTDLQKEQAFSCLSQRELNALRISARSIRKFALSQKKALRSFTARRSGLITGQFIVPMERVGCYVRGKKHSFPSRALMTVIPAKVANVTEIIVCSPDIKPATIAAATIAGANKIYSLGGAQAIAAMAYGTETIPKVDMIVGSGNKYVTAAKKYVFGDVNIDMLGEHPRLFIIADESSNPNYIAADMIAQAEHDQNAVVICATPSHEIALRVRAEIETQIEKVEPKFLIEQNLEKHGTIIITPNLSEAARISNMVAPSCLELHVKDPHGIIMLLKHFGSLFIGQNSSKVFGDYSSGPNHVLPEGGTAKFFSGLSPCNFIKIQTFQEVKTGGLPHLYRTSIKMAEIEGYNGQKNAISVRLFRKR